MKNLYVRVLEQTFKTIQKNIDRLKEIQTELVNSEKKAAEAASTYRKLRPEFDECEKGDVYIKVSLPAKQTGPMSDAQASGSGSIDSTGPTGSSGPSGPSSQLGQSGPSSTSSNSHTSPGRL
jgi:hypothetical protein